MRPPLTAEQVERVLEVYQQTLQTVKVVEIVGVSYAQVVDCLKAHGIPLSGAQNGVCYQNIDNVRQWAKDGLSISEIARRVGTNNTRVREFLKQHNFERKPFVQTMKNNSNWKGGRKVDGGYVYLKMPGHHLADSHGYVPEHRLVMEEKLGRPLTREEVVHHVDDDGTNNEPDNLRLYPNNAAHLADTLKGKVPNWSEDGKRRIQEGSLRGVAARRSPNQLELEIDVSH